MWGAALKDCEKALKLDQNNLKALILQAECLVNQGKRQVSSHLVEMGLAKLG